MAQNQNIGLLGQYLTVNTTANTITFNSNSSISTAFITGSGGGSSSGGFTVNTSVMTIGNTTVFTTSNSTHFFSGNSTVYGYGNSIADVLVSTSGNLVLSSTSITIANSTVNVFIANTSGIYTTGIVNAASHTVGTNFIANTTQLTISGIPLSANGYIGSAGQVLSSNSSGGIYWATGGSGGTGYTGSAGTGGGGGFANGQSISVANLAITGSMTAASATGTAGQVLTSTGTGVYWGTPGTTYSYSSYFNGTSSYLGVASNAIFGFGVGDFTIELWVYPLSQGGHGNSNNDCLMDFRNASGTAVAAGTLYISSSGTGVQWYVNGANRITGTAISSNTWTHISVVRISGSTKMYFNGVQVGSTYTDSNSYITAPLWIGQFNDGAGAGWFNGYISNLRIVKGVGVYTGAFTPPTSPLTVTQAYGTNIAAISGTSTSILICQTQSINDISTNNLSITNTGVGTNQAVIPFASTNVSVAATSLTSVRQQFTGDGTTTSFSVAGGYTPNAISAYLNGVLLRNGTEVTVTSGTSVVFASAPPSGALIDVIGTVPTTYSSITPVSYSVQLASASSQYLASANSSAYAFGTGDFTIECWFNSLSTLNYPTLFTTSLAYATTGGFRVTGGPNNNTLQVATAGTQLFATTATFTNNVWNHIAVVRISGTTKLYLNGVLVGSASDSTNYTTTEFVIGNNTGAGSPYFFNGYISNLRVVKGVGVYTNAFTPPTSPLQAIQSAGSNIQAITGTQTSLLTCNGPTIIDGSTNAFTITNNGAATVSTAIVPTFTNVTITSGSSSSSSGGLSLAAVQTANLTATAGNIYPINTSSGPVYVTLPASPTAGQQLSIFDYAGYASANAIVINPNGNKLTGTAANVSLGTNKESVALVYVDSTQGWCAYGGFTNNPIGPYTVTYLVVAGGGGGGGNGGGGGGAGGLLTATLSITPGTIYTVTVGAGGAGGSSGSGNNGSNSSIVSNFSTITAIGGGGGSTRDAGGTSVAGSGGSGGGGGGTLYSNQAVPGSGTAGQGNAGGSGTGNLSTNSSGGGGGGAGAAGTSGASQAAGAGGVGLQLSITGTATYYAGGGGGGVTVNGSGAAGGSGGGGSGVGAGTAGANNTGGGGGGVSLAGGSGVVIFSIPTGNYSGIKSGANTVATISGPYTILTFNSSGTYTG
jgi:hypothetical protein